MSWPLKQIRVRKYSAFFLSPAESPRASDRRHLRGKITPAEDNKALILEVNCPTLVLVSTLCSYLPTTIAITAPANTHYPSGVVLDTDRISKYQGSGSLHSLLFPVNRLVILDPCAMLFCGFLFLLPCTVMPSRRLESIAGASDNYLLVNLNSKAVR